MNVNDIFLLVVRWLHLVSAAAWIGGGLFYIVVLRSASRRPDQSQGSLNNTSTSTEFRALVDTCMLVLLVTGIILTFNRLTIGVVGVPYALVLGLKIFLSVWMFFLARGTRSRSSLRVKNEGGAQQARTRLQKVAHAISGYNAIIILGIVVFLLADLLKILFEKAVSLG